MKHESITHDHSNGNKSNEIENASRNVENKVGSGSTGTSTSSMRPVGRVSLSELLDAPPLTFSNHVTLRKFDGATM